MSLLLPTSTHTNYHTRAHGNCHTQIRTHTHTHTENQTKEKRVSLLCFSNDSGAREQDVETAPEGFT